METTSYPSGLEAVELVPPVSDWQIARAESNVRNIMLETSAKVHILRIKSIRPFLGPYRIVQSLGWLRMVVHSDITD